MKKIAILFFLFFVFRSVDAQQIIISKKGFLIDEVNIHPYWRFSDLKEKLGNSFRDFTGLVNLTHVYDSIGIVIYEHYENNKAPSGQINEVQVYWQLSDKDETKPKEVFTGDITFNKLKLNRSVSYKSLRKNMKGWRKVDTYSAHTYRYSNGFIYLFFSFNESETELQRISIGSEFN